MENWKYLVVDEATEGILISAPSLELAVHLAKGFINARVTLIPLHREFFKKYIPFNFEDEHLGVTIYRDVSQLEPAKVTSTYLAQRTLARARLKALESLQTYCFLGRIPATFGFTDEIAAEIDLELLRCRPTEGFFTPAIVEFAHLQHLSAETAYEELKMRVEGARLIKIRNFAVFDKYSRIINQSQEHELDSHLAQVLDEVFLNSMV